MSAPFYDRHGVTVHAGDCLDILATMADASVDAVVTDPPYGLEFMGKEWDSFKPGGKQPKIGAADGTPFRRSSGTPSWSGSGNPACLNCGGTKYDRTRPNGCTCSNPRFPNEAAAHMRAFQQWCETWGCECLRVLKPGGYLVAFGGSRTYHRLTAGLEDAGLEIRDSMFWAYGSGFPKGRNQLKPAHEPIVLARKPPIGTVAANVLAHGTGGLNVDACRTGTGGQLAWAKPRGSGQWEGGTHVDHGPCEATEAAQGRWPANVLLSHAARCDNDGCDPSCPVAELDAQSGTLTSGANPTRRSSDKFREAYGDFKGQTECVPARGADSGGASRFFPVFRWEAKAPTAERPQVDGVAHPTVKPLDLMRWLVRLVTPPGGLVLDPFAGSGTTLHAARAEGFRALGIEREPSYLPLIKARLDARPRSATAPTIPVPDGEPLDLFDLLGDAS